MKNMYFPKMPNHRVNLEMLTMLDLCDNKKI